MRFAYADPPYPGLANYYPERAEVDHASLVDRLVQEFPDGWALSTSSKALRDVLALCPPDVRICAWFHGPRRTKSRRALASWEPLIVWRGRPLPTAVVQDLSDGLIDESRYRAFPGAMIGMKPPGFAEWLFRQLGAVPGDELADLFPGSGAIGRAWIRFAFAGQLGLPLDASTPTTRRVSRPRTATRSPPAGSDDSRPVSSADASRVAVAGRDR